MQHAWLNFAIIVFVQFLFFLILAISAKNVSNIPRVLGQGVLIGVVLGIPFDIIWGKFFGLHSFALGFEPTFLVLNAIFSYGIFVASILLLQSVKLSNFCIWAIAIMTVYEVTNHFFPVWTWGFTLPPVGLLIVLSFGYFGGAILIAVVSQVFLKRQFAFIKAISL